MLYRIGRSLQVVGMILLPIAIAGNLAPGDQPGTNQLDLRTSLTISAVGILVFVLGYLIQQAGRPR
jgi:hypothetical protein